MITPIERSRAERYVGGKTPKEIATEDGRTVMAVYQHLHRVIRRGARLANPKAPLPADMRRNEGGLNGIYFNRISPDKVAWALKLIDTPLGARVCECCHRRL